jgi:hypothetical protein
MVFGFYDKPSPARLPHPPIRLPVLLVIEHALCAAWELLRTRPRVGFNLSSADEDVVTLEFYEALFDRVFDKGIVKGFDRQVFCSVTREPKIRNYNYKHPDKMPDLFIRLVGRPISLRNSQDGLFIECKPVDTGHAVREHYCKKGLIRFIRGEYAWAMTNAMMIGYARKGYTISPKLIDALKSPPKGISSITLPRPCRQSKAGTNSEAVYCTVHARTFKYGETGELAPPITIRHLWLKRE